MVRSAGQDVATIAGRARWFAGPVIAGGLRARIWHNMCGGAGCRLSCNNRGGCGLRFPALLFIKQIHTDREDIQVTIEIVYVARCMYNVMYRDIH